MKKFFLLSLSVVLFSCTPAVKRVPNQRDTVQIIARNNDDNLFIDSAVRVISQVKKLKDTGSMELAWVTDTAYYLSQVIDTQRNAAGKPIYDSALKVWKARTAFSPIAVPDSLNRYIRLTSDLPFHKHR